MKQRVEELGQNEIVTIVDGEYNPTVAVNRAQDLVESGQEFDILWVMDEDMAAAVIRYLESQNLLDRYTVIAQNGSPAGIPLVQQGQLDYTISSSPGWEGMVAFLALHHYVTTAGAGVEMDRQIMLPVIPVTEATINDPTKVVPWEPHRVVDRPHQAVLPGAGPLPAGGEPGAAAAVSGPVLSMRGVTKSFGDTVALRDVRFDLGRERSTASSGKTGRASPR